MPQRIQTFDSNGPNVKIRGNAYQVFERYVSLAREAAASGDRIAAENLYQHAEHYFRIMNANGDAHAQGAPRPMTPADTEMMGHEGEASEPLQYQQQQHVQQQHGAPQPDRPAPQSAPPHHSEEPRHESQQPQGSESSPSPTDPLAG